MRVLLQFLSIKHEMGYTCDLTATDHAAQVNGFITPPADLCDGLQDSGATGSLSSLKVKK